MAAQIHTGRDPEPTPQPAWRKGRMQCYFPAGGVAVGGAIVVLWAETGGSETGIWDGEKVWLPAFTPAPDPPGNTE